MPDISVTKTKEDAASASLQVLVPTDKIEKAEKKVVKQYGAQARLPGFRPGKAPEAVVRRRFNDAIRQATLEQLIRDSWDVAQQTEGLKPIAEPHIHNLKFEVGQPLEFEFHVEVRPNITVSKVSGFKLERKVAPVDDAAVEERLRDLQERKATWTPIEGTKPAPGNLVQMEVAPLDGETAGTTQPYSMVLGEGRAIPEVEEKVMSLLPGETVDADVRFPDDHPDESKRGTSRRVRISLHEVKRQELPPLDDSFAREVGDFENLAALRAALRKDLEGDAQQTADGQVRQQLLDQIYQTNEVPAPVSLVNRLIQGYMQAYEIPKEQFETFAAEFRPVAEQQVRRELVLDAVVENNKLAATNAEVDERVAKLAEGRNMKVGELYAQLEKSGRLRDLERSLTEEKAFAWLLPQSTVVEN
jgi:trigger factor